MGRRIFAGLPDHFNAAGYFLIVDRSRCRTVWKSQLSQRQRELWGFAVSKLKVWRGVQFDPE